MKVLFPCMLYEQNNHRIGCSMTCSMMNIFPMFECSLVCSVCKETCKSLLHAQYIVLHG